MKYVYASYSPADTLELGILLGRLLQPGDIVCLDGELGAGKTALVRGIAMGMEIEHSVTSPTYTLIHQYPGKIPLYHFDVYRLENGGGLYDIGGEELLYDGGVSVIEWASRVKDILPDERLWVDISLCPGEDSKRLIEITATGERYMSILEGIRKHEDTGH